MMAFSWFTGNTLEASSDRPLALRARGLSDEASRVFPVNHSMPSSNYNISAKPLSGSGITGLYHSNACMADHKECMADSAWCMSFCHLVYG